MNIIDSDFEYLSNINSQEIVPSANISENDMGLIDPDFEYIFPGQRKTRSYSFRPDYLRVLLEDEFFKRFRMNKQSFLVFLNLIRHHLEPNSAR